MRREQPGYGKPSAVYRNRMQRYRDEVWLIWSNKWGCWYRAKSSGYTDDIAQAGLYTREEAAKHMQPPGTPKKHRDTEPFPISAVRHHIRRRREQLEIHISMLRDREQELACLEELVEP